MAKKTTVSKVTREAGLRRELDRETKKILQLKEEVAKNFWDLGSSLCRVHDKKLYGARGHHSFEDYLQSEVKISRSNAYQLMDLAKNFSRETAVKFGKEKLLCAIDYANATPEPDLPLDVTRYTIPARNKTGKKVQKTFKQASVREIKRAAALLRKKPELQTPAPLLRLPSLSGLLSGKVPRLRVDQFLSKSKEKLKAVTPRPNLSVKVIKKGEDPLLDLHLSGIQSSTLMQALGLLTMAASEVWMESVQ